MDAEKIIELYNNPSNCPFCGSKAISEMIWNWDGNVPAVSCTNEDCVVSKNWFSFKLWCTRPLEDVLQEKIDYWQNEATVLSVKLRRATEVLKYYSTDWYNSKPARDALIDIDGE